MTLYEQLAQHLIEGIQTQRLPAGTKLPALRTLAKQHNVSVNTATRTYDYLVENGWINAQPQSGYFVNPSAPPLFATAHAFPLEKRDPKQYRPALGYQPNSSGFSPLGEAHFAPHALPEQALQRTIKRIVSRSGHRLFQYPNQQGEPLLREALAQHFRRYEFSFLPDELVITHGCLQAIQTAIESVTQANDTLAVCSPCFNGLLELVTTLSRNIIEIPVNAQGIDLDALETCMATKKISAALLSSTNINPVGITLPTEQKRRIAQLAANYKIPVIEDDVYFELSLPQYRVLPAKYWDTQGYVIWCASVSKTLAPGLRMGWCLPGKYLDAFLNRHAKTNMGVNTLVQSSVAEFISTGDYASQINSNRQRLQQQLYQYRQTLAELLPPSARISAPTGGLVLWIHLPGTNTRDIATAASKKNIEIRSGDCFSTHGEYNDYFRINCGWPLEPKNSDTEQSAFHQLQSLCEIIRNG